VPCGASYWILTADRPVCLVCGNPPTHTIPFSSVDGAPAPGTLTSPEPASPADDGPVVFHEKCPHCDNEITIELTESSLEVRPDVARPAGDQSPDEPGTEGPGESGEPAFAVSEDGDGDPAGEPPPSSPSEEPAEVTS